MKALLLAGENACPTLARRGAGAFACRVLNGAGSGFLQV